MPKADSLIRTKLCPPPVRAGSVPRPRLRERMAQGACRPLTLVTAPAGFGKTTLVASWIRDCERPVAWLSLDRDDNRAGRFLNYLVAALREADPTLGEQAAQLLTAPQPAPPEAILTGLVNDLHSTQTEITLVLDDYHFINDPAVHEAITFLLEHGPTTLHLVIVTRSDPPLPLARLRARGQIVELRAADLSFTEAEAAQFLNGVMDLDVDAESVAALEERTEGWIAGLQMAALSMQGREDVSGFIEAFAGTHRFIMDFMLEEVLARESEETRTFLLQTAVLTRLTGPLCDAVTGRSSSQEILEGLERRNLFVVPLDDDRRWYRYHHLFADLLQARLRQSSPDRVPQLLSRAATWCEQAGQVSEAVGYAFAAEDYRQAAALVERYWWHAMNDGEIETVWSWLDALPEGLVGKSAPLSVASSWILWLTGQIGAIEPHLVNAERALGELAVPDGIDKNSPLATLPAELAALRSFVARYKGEFESAGALAEHALSLVPDGLPPLTDAQLHGLIFLALATAYDGAGDLERAVSAYRETIRWGRRSSSAIGIAITYRLAGSLRLLGRLREADAVCREALEYLRGQGMDRLPAAGILHVALSEVLVEQNELEAAEAHLAEGFELGKWSGRLDAVRNAAYTLTRLRQARDDLQGALAAVAEAEAALGEPPSPLAQAELLALKARMLVRQEGVDEAAQCAEEAVNLASGDRGQTGEMAALAASRVLLAQSKPGAAVAALTRALAAAEERGLWGVALELHILRGLAFLQQKDSRAAGAELEAALALAEPEGYVRIFLDEGRPLQRLLAQWLARADPGPLRDYALRLLSHFEAEVERATPAPEEGSHAGDLIEPLTERELEVLHLVALGMTNREIAQQLVVAPGTVKAHTSSIYRKLDVANRTEAAARARQLGILP